jgi:hypothetical protein
VGKSINVSSIFLKRKRWRARAKASGVHNRIDVKVRRGADQQGQQGENQKGKVWGAQNPTEGRQSAAARLTFGCLFSNTLKKYK